MSWHLAATLPLLEIIGINIVLSGDNAVLVAMAIHHLPLSQRRSALVFGVGGAIVVRILATLVVSQLFQIPLLLCIGGLLLSWIALRLLRDEEQKTPEPPPVETLGHAVRTVIMADCLMSLDNVLAVASVGWEHPALVAFGLLMSIALVMTSSVLIVELMNRYPFLVTMGAGILAWTGGRMIATDTVIHQAVWSEFGTDLKDGPWWFLLSIVMMAVVLTASRWWHRAKRGSSALTEPVTARPAAESRTGSEKR
jgi:YjbE family integral membrane protein